MSFRTYPPNPILKRLREANMIDAKGAANTLQATVTTVRDEHAISAYGTLIAPHSFVQDESKRVRPKRKNSGARRPQPKLEVKKPDDTKVATPSQDLSLPSSTPTIDENASDSSEDETDEDWSGRRCSLTGRPVCTAAYEEDTDDAVILKAKWEKLRRVRARTIRLPPRDSPKDN